MANLTVSSNMNLTIPTVGVEAGPAYAADVNNCLNVIDSHNHGPNSGVRITPNGLNINADLAMNSNNLTLVNTVRFNSLSGSIPNSPPNVGCLYINGNELYFNDYSGGHSIAITNNGNVNAGAGSIGGLPSGTASVNYTASTYVFQSATNVAATLDVASVILRNTSPSSNGLTLQAPTLGSSYSITLPTLPPNTSTPPSGATVLIMDTAGNIIASSVQHQAFNPPGVVQAYAGSVAPAGYLLCDGTSYLRADYPGLFTAIGVTYGSVDGTHFNVPDLRDRTPFGIGTNFTLAQIGGFRNPSLDTMVSHDHSFHDPGHTHAFYTSQGAVFGGNFNASSISGGTLTQPTSGVSTGITFTGNGNSTTNGNMPPFIGMNYIIKT